MYEGFDPNNPFLMSALASAQSPMGLDPQSMAMLGVLAGYRPQNQAPAAPLPFEGMQPLDAMPGGVTAAPSPAASGAAPWGMLSEDRAREEVSRSVQDLGAEAGRRKEILEQAKQAEAPAILWGMPVMSPEEAQAAAERQYAEAKARERHAEAQLSGEASLPTTTPERNFAETAYQSAGKSLASMPKFAGYIGGWLASEAGSEAQTMDNAVFGLGQNIENWAVNAFPGDPARADEFGTKAANLAGFLATLYGAGGVRAMTEGGPLLVEKLGRAVSAGSQAGLAASSGAMGQFEGASRAMEQDANVTERDRAISTLLGAGVGLTSLVPLASSLATPAEREAGAIMAEALKGSGVTASQMVGFNVANNAISKAMYDPGRSLTEGLGDDVALGGMAGFLTHGIGAAAKTRRSSPEEIQDFINRARSASSDPDAAAYFNGMRDWVNANMPRLPAPGGEAPAPTAGEPGPAPKGAPSSDIRESKGHLDEWVSDVYGEGYRGEAIDGGAKLAIVTPDGRRLITYDKEDLAAAGALPEPRNVTESGPYSIRGNWREEAHDNRRLSERTGEGSQGEGAQDQIAHPQAEKRGGEEGSAGQSGRAGGEGGAYRRLDQVRDDVPDEFSFKNRDIDYNVTATRVEPSDGKLDAVRFWASPKGAAPDPRGPAAKVLLEQRPDSRWEVSWMNVSKPFRGSKLMGDMYDAIEREYGLKMHPSGHLMEGGYRFWSERNPELVKYHQLVEGEDWHSPRYIKGEIDWAERQVQDLDPVEDWEEIQSIQNDARPWKEAFDRVPEEGKTPEALEAQFALRGFYRPDMRAVENVKQEKATAQQWSAMLSKAPGARRWLDLIGFDEWAGAQKGSISRDDVLAFMRVHDVDIEERQLGKGTWRSEDLAKFGNYKIPGGQGYREILLKLPSLLGKWVSPHFNTNEIIHIRADDRVLPTGEKVLFLHELQSDLHQQGRQKGYAGEKPTKEEIDAASHQASEKTKEINSKRKTEIERLSIEKYGKTSDGITDEEFDVISNDVEDLLRPLKTELRDLLVRVNELGDAAKDDKAPDAPFKGDWWWEIGLKNLIRKGAEEGYDAVSIARSDQIEEVVGADEGSLSVFYDQKMPKFIEKYAKKLGGVVEKTQVIDQQGNLVINITPEMREKVLGEGQALSRAADRALAEMIEALNAGKAVDIDPAAYGQVHKSVQPLRQALPESIPVRALARVEPKEGGSGLFLTFDDGAGNVSRMSAKSVNDFANLGGFCLPDGSAIYFVSLAPGEASESSPAGGREVGAGDAHGGVFLHETVHSLFRQQRIPADDWGRFVSHAQGLRVMDMPMTDFLQAIGEEPQPGEVTLRDVYELLYQNKAAEERRSLIDEEEPVAHMVQLFHLRRYTGEQMQPIADILHKMISGGYATETHSE